MKSQIKLLWSDRKRILGMPITFTKYSLSEDRLFMETGLLNTRQEEVILYRVRDLSLSISLFQRIFGVGTVTVHSSDKSMPHLEMKNIKHPMDVKELLHKQVEEMKIARRMRIGEVLHDDDDSDGDEDEAFYEDGCPK